MQGQLPTASHMYVESIILRTGIPPAVLERKASGAVDGLCADPADRARARLLRGVDNGADP